MADIELRFIDSPTRDTGMSFINTTEEAEPDVQEGPSKELISLPPEEPKQFTSESTILPQLPKREGYRRGAGAIMSMQEAPSQTMAGAVKAGDLMLNIAEALPSPIDLITDPLRVLDYARPFANFGIAAAEWTANIALDATSHVVESVSGEPLGRDLELPRIKAEFGSYPERDPEYDPMYNPKAGAAKARLTKDKKLRTEWLKRYEDYYTKQYKTKPIITDVMGYIPDLLTIGAGGAMNSPKVAAFVEGILGGAHAGQDGDPTGEGVVLGALSGYGGTKVVNGLMNKLSPKELDDIRLISLDPALKEDSINLLKFFRDHPQFSRSDIVRGKTGIPYLDEQSNRMMDSMGREAFEKYATTLSNVSGKVQTTISEAADMFAKNSNEVYLKFKATADSSWDDLAKNLDSGPTVPTDKMKFDIDNALADAPDVVKTFARKLLQPTNYENSINQLRSKRKAALLDLESAKVGQYGDELKKIKQKFRASDDELTKEIKILEAMEAEGQININSQGLIDMIKKLNNKAYVAGGNINVGDQAQHAGLLTLKSSLETQLNQMPGVNEFKGIYDKAKGSSKDMYDLFGYANSGKNMGKNVFSPELGKVLNELEPEKVKIVDRLLTESPEVFNSKLGHMSKYLDTKTTETLKQVYIEKKLSGSLTWLSKADMKTPTIAYEKFRESASGFLDTADGRLMVKDLYGQDTLDGLTLVRSIGDMLKDPIKGVPKTTMRAFVKDLPRIVTTLVGGHLEDYAYTTRMLKQYGEATKTDLGALVKEHIASRVAGSVAGAYVAPEGSEMQGAVVGGIAGKWGSFMRMMLRTGPGKKLVAKGVKAKDKTKEFLVNKLKEK